MRMLGIDLASQARTTAACAVEWRAGGAEVVELEVGADDARLLEQAGEADRVGIDAPFGWPLAFVALMAHHHGGGRGAPDWSPGRRDELRFRRTDVVVKGVLGRWPLSVSTDLIGIVALRCAGLLDRLGVEDRSGEGRVVETYPAVALHAWGFPSRGYKGGGEAVAALLGEVRRACPWLTLSEEAAALCGRSDHALDALVASLVARAAAVGVTGRPGAEEREAARVEGWIAVPRAGSLPLLAGGTAWGGAREEGSQSS